MPAPAEKKEAPPVAAEAKDKKSEDKKKKSEDPDMAIKKEDLSEEDQRLKDEVALLVERAQDKDYGIAATALNSLSDKLRTATGTVASIPKPLKYVRPFFAELRKHAEALPASAAHGPALFDVLAFIAMTLELPEKNVVIDLKLKGTKADIGVWGHEFLKHLAGGIRHRFKVFLPLANSQKLIHRVALSRKRRTDRQLKCEHRARFCEAGFAIMLNRKKIHKRRKQ